MITKIYVGDPVTVEITGTAQDQTKVPGVTEVGVVDGVLSLEKSNGETGHILIAVWGGVSWAR